MGRWMTFTWPDRAGEGEAPMPRPRLVGGTVGGIQNGTHESAILWVYLGALRRPILRHYTNANNLYGSSPVQNRQSRPAFLEKLLTAQRRSKPPEASQNALMQVGIPHRTRSGRANF